MSTAIEPATTGLADPRPTSAPASRVVAVCDGIGDVVVLVLATWTPVYHLCLLTRWGAAASVALEGALLAVAVLVWGYLAPPRTTEAEPAAPRPQPRPARRALVTTAVGAAVVSALLCAVGAPWVLVALTWLVAAVVAVGWSLVAAPARVAAGRVTGQVETLVPLLWAAALAALATVTLRPNPDDLYYVNMSQWVVDHGTFPVRDTIFSDLVFPMASWPPMASYDALVGLVARLVGVHAATVAYVVVPPLATALAVLAMWRLLRAWGVRRVAVALSLALVFLLLDAGGEYSSPGDLFLTRLWQGKVILLCVMVPTLLVYALRHARNPTPRHLGWLAAGGVAAVGLSTTALFLVPIIAVAGAAPLAVRRPLRALLGAAAMAAYPLAAGVVTLALGGHSADDFESRRLYRFDPAWFGHDIFLHGVVAAVGVSAVLVAPFLLPDRAARLTTALLALVVGITFVPGVTHLSYDLIGLGPTLWRVSWVASIAACVGVLGAAAVDHAPPGRLRAVPPSPSASGAGSCSGLTGTPIWSSAAGVELHPPPHWQRNAGSLETATAIIHELSAGDVVLAPPDLATTLDVTTTRIKTVAPRKYYMDYLKGQTGFHFPARGRLMDFVDTPPGHTTDRAALAHDLAAVGVDAVCLRAERPAKLRFVERLGFTPFASNAAFTCLRR